MPVLPLHNEKALLAEMASGDEKAFRCVFDHYWNGIYAVAFAFTRSASLSEEIVQDVFLKIWLKREQLPSINRFQSYLFIIARNHILNQLRSRAHDLKFVAEPDNHFAANYLSPEQQLILKETNWLVNQALEHLPPRQREIYRLSRQEGLDTNAIARELGISRLTVKSHMTKALQAIRQYLHHSPDKLLVFVIIQQLLQQAR